MYGPLEHLGRHIREVKVVTSASVKHSHNECARASISELPFNHEERGQLINGTAHHWRSDRRVRLNWRYRLAGHRAVGRVLDSVIANVSVAKHLAEIFLWVCSIVG